MTATKIVVVGKSTQSADRAPTATMPRHPVRKAFAAALPRPPGLAGRYPPFRLAIAPIRWVAGIPLPANYPPTARRTPHQKGSCDCLHKREAISGPSKHPVQSAVRRFGFPPHTR